jgi:hypothetical protein
VAIGIAATGRAAMGLAEHGNKTQFEVDRVVYLAVHKLESAKEQHGAFTERLFSQRIDGNNGGGDDGKDSQRKADAIDTRRTSGVWDVCGGGTAGNGGDVC